MRRCCGVQPPDGASEVLCNKTEYWLTSLQRRMKRPAAPRCDIPALKASAAPGIAAGVAHPASLAPVERLGAAARAGAPASHRTPIGCGGQRPPLRAGRLAIRA